MSISDAVFENHSQEQFGLPLDRVRSKVKDHMAESVQAFIRKSPFAILATCDAEGKCDASPRGGTAGFVRVIDERHLLLPDVAGNKLFQSYGNIEKNPNVGLVFFIPGLNDTVRVNGLASVVGKEELDQREMSLSVHQPDDNARHLQGLLIKVEEAFTHCPRSLNFGNLWDIETIKRNQEKRPLPPRAVGK